VRDSPDFAAMVPLAQTTVCDTLLIAAVSTPTPAMLGTNVPTTILHGEPAAPELIVVPESHEHAVDPAGTLRVVLARLD